MEDSDVTIYDTVAGVMLDSAPDPENDGHFVIDPPDGLKLDCPSCHQQVEGLAFCPAQKEIATAVPCAHELSGDELTELLLSTNEELPEDDDNK